MSCFTTKTLNQKALDPTKRVKYTLGMVLGPDEFEQNLTYLMERDRLHNRSLHGYGTVCGLKVMQRPDPEDPELPASPPQVLVGPGLAINPQGQFIRVPEAQCADLNRWLDTHESEVYQHLGSPVTPDRLTLYAVLCFAECESDATFVPGGPCRSQEDTIVPSRVADAFELKLSFERPAQVEDEVINRFGDLLCRIEITADAASYVSREELENLVRDLAQKQAPAALSSPPESADLLFLHPDQAAEILDDLFRLWVTEVRPALLACGKNCAGGPPDEDCVLLARLDFDIGITSTGRIRVDGLVDVDEGGRPILLQTRLLQEQLLCDRATYQYASPATFATLSLRNTSTIRAWIHFAELLDIPTSAVTLSGTAAGVLNVTTLGSTNVFDIELDAPLDLSADQVLLGFDAAQITETVNPAQTLLVLLDELSLTYIDREGDILLAYLAVDLYTLNDLTDVDAQPTADGDVLTWDQSAGQWTAQVAAAGGVIEHHDLNGLGDDDHPQYLLVDNTTRALLTNLDAGGNRISNLSPGTATGEAVTFAQAVKNGDAAGGDLTGNYPDPQVAGLQGRPVSNAGPNIGHVLRWDGSQWVPTPGEEGILLPFASISPVDNRAFEVWFHVQVPPNRASVVGFDPDALRVFAETNSGPNFVTRIDVQSVTPTARNLFVVQLAAEGRLLRFRFDARRITVDTQTTSDTLRNYALVNGIRFVGQDESLRTVTRFVRVRG